MIKQIAIGVLLGFGAIGVFGIDGTPEPKIDPVVFRNDVLKSRWYWLDSEIHAVPIGSKSIYRDLQKEVELKLSLSNQCVKRSHAMGTTWESCDAAKR